MLKGSLKSRLAVDSSFMLLWCFHSRISDGRPKGFWEYASMRDRGRASIDQLNDKTHGP